MGLKSFKKSKKGPLKSGSSTPFLPAHPLVAHTTYRLSKPVNAPIKLVLVSV